MSLTIALLVPFYNESELTINRTCQILASFLHENQEVKLLVVDDGSHLNAFNNLEKAVEVSFQGRSFQILRSEKNLGYGGAINFGLRTLKSQNFDWVVIADSELSMRLEDLETMLKAIQKFSGASAVKSTRYFLKDGFDQLIGPRRILSILGKNVSKFLTMYKISDPTTGFRALNLEFIQLDNRIENGFSSIAEEMNQLISISIKKKLSIVQVPYIYQCRSAVDRKSSFGFTWELLSKYLKYFCVAFGVLLKSTLTANYLTIITFNE